MPRSRVPEQAAQLINQIQLSYVRKIQYYSEQALVNFYEAVNLSQKSVLQDMLRILKIMEDFNTDIENHSSSSPNDSGKFYIQGCWANSDDFLTISIVRISPTPLYIKTKHK